MEKELKESLARYADLEKKLIENKEARLAGSGNLQELKEEAVALREAYIAEEKVRNDLVNKIEAAKAEGDE